jgi:hypothetical protein
MTPHVPVQTPPPVPPPILVPGFCTPAPPPPAVPPKPTVPGLPELPELPGLPVPPMPVILTFFTPGGIEKVPDALKVSVPPGTSPAPSTPILEDPMGMTYSYFLNASPGRWSYLYPAHGPF